MSLHTIDLLPEGRRRLAAAPSGGRAPDAFLTLIDPDFKNKATLDSGAGPEQVAATFPDLVVIKGSTEDQLAKSFAQIGIPAMYLGLEPPGLFYQDVANLGVVLGSEARAKEITTYYLDRLSRIREQTASAGGQPKPWVLTIQHSSRGSQVSFSVPPSTWFQTIQAETAGGDPAWLETGAGSTGWVMVNFEPISRWDPDMIFVVS